MEKPATSILAVDDEETLLSTLSMILKQQGYYVDTAHNGRDAISMLHTLPFDLVLLDVMMPDVGGIEVLKYVSEQHLDTEVIMLTAVQDVKTAVECMRLGAYYYVNKPYLASDLIALIDRALERKRLVIQNKALRRQLAYRALPSSLITENPTLLGMLETALRAALTDSTVLIQGATGTGKEVVANFIHANSLRKDQPFLVLGCSSTPEEQIEWELFGRERGNSSSTPARQGLLEIAAGGTLFIDEISALPLQVQPKLLAFLQTGEFSRAGGKKRLKSDVRIFSSTSTSLETLVAEKWFRQDLFQKLDDISLQLPALRERKEDIPLLVDRFLLDHAGTKPPKKLEPAALEALISYDWPGNVRELENVVRRAAVLAEGEMIELHHVAFPKSFPFPVKPGRETTQKLRRAKPMSLARLEKEHMKSILKSVHWDQVRASKILGISTRKLAEKLKTHKLHKPR